MLEITDPGNTQNVPANAVRRLRIAAGALFHHPLAHRDREGAARRLDRLKIDRREQPRLYCIAPFGWRIGENVRQCADALTGRAFQARRRIARLAHIAHGREAFRDIEDTVGADRYDRRPFHVRTPDPARKRAGIAVGRQRIGWIERDDRKLFGPPMSLFGKFATVSGESNVAVWLFMRW